MMKSFYTWLPVLVLLLSACGSGKKNSIEVLDAMTFWKKTEEPPGATIIDVRTAGEFDEGHIDQARNIDWQETTFDAQLAKLDKSKPYFVYCMAGGRSSEAAEH